MTSHSEISKSFDTRWDYNYAALKQYVEENGTSRVPGNISYSFQGRSVPLGPWVAAQRRRYRAGLLPTGRANNLAALACWAWGPLLPGPGEDAARNEDIRVMRDSGASLAKIGDAFGLSRQRIHQIVSSRGR